MREQPWRRVLDAVVGALGELSCVRAVASFGSVAEGRADGWSDVDLLVSCEEVGRTAWLGAAAVRAAKPVAYYRMFTGVPQPSGRYWFGDEPPFNRLDVSFYAPAEFVRVRGEGVREGHPLVSRVEYVATRPPDPDADARLRAPWEGAVVPAEETQAGRALYVFLETLKRARRGGCPADEVEPARRGLEEALGRGGYPVGFARLADRALAL